MYDTSYLNMQSLSAGICFRSDSSFREIPAILYPRSITADILEWHRFLKPNALLSSADITQYKHSPFSLKKSHVTHSNMSSATSSVR